MTTDHRVQLESSLLACSSWRSSAAVAKFSSAAPSPANIASAALRSRLLDSRPRFARLCCSNFFFGGLISLLLTLHHVLSLGNIGL